MKSDGLLYDHFKVNGFRYDNNDQFLTGKPIKKMWMSVRTMTISFSAFEETF